MDEGRLINRHIPVLDGLRGLAIIAVIVCHVNCCSYGGPISIWSCQRAAVSDVRLDMGRCRSFLRPVGLPHHRYSLRRKRL